MRKRRAVEEEERCEDPPRVTRQDDRDMCGAVVECSVEGLDTFDAVLKRLASDACDMTFTVEVPGYLMSSVGSEGPKTLTELTKEWEIYRGSMGEMLTAQYANRIVNVLRRQDVPLRRRSSNWRRSRFYVQYVCGDRAAGASGCCRFTLTYYGTKGFFTGEVRVPSGGHSYTQAGHVQILGARHEAFRSDGEKNTPPAQRTLAASLEKLHQEIS